MPLAAVLILAALLGLAAPAEARPHKKKKAKPARVLVYSGTVGFRHDSIPFGNAVIKRMGRLTGRWRTSVTEDPAALTAKRLRKADVVLWNNTTGAESPFSEEQQAAYERFVACGGGHIGVHASADSYKDWPVWFELTGAFFKSHPITPTSIADGPPEFEGYGEPEAEILVQDQRSRITAPWRGLESFRMRDEYYAFDRDPAQTISRFRPLLAFGGFTDPLVAVQFGGDYADEQPLSWTGSFRGRNRIYYTNLGHSASTWHRGDFQDALIEGITWVAKKRPKRACLR